MIGNALKKYAQENGMKVAKGVAYGNFRGYAATMSEGSGFKQVIITTKFMEAGDADSLLAELNATELQRTYAVRNLNIAHNGIAIVFTDSINTMKKIKAFMDWFIPVLSKYSATAWNICAECNSEMIGGRWILIDGIAHYLHDNCAQKVKEEIAETEQAQREQSAGSYASGAVGAAAGAILGAVVWGIVLCLGYVASLVGLLIGWLSNKGYGLMKGKEGKAKVAILIFAVILGVVIGTLGGYAVSLWIETNKVLDEVGMDALPASEILALFVGALEDGELTGYIVKDILMGLLFAALGVFAMLKKTSMEVSGTKIVDLE